jgi:hypothetical protein
MRLLEDEEECKNECGDERECEAEGRKGMSTRSSQSPATVTTSGPALNTVRPKGRDDSGIMLIPAEVALLRVCAKPGTEGNALILRSGVVVPLTYAEAVEMRNSLRFLASASLDVPKIRKLPFEVVR